MSDENKQTPELEGQGNDLESELEELRDTFQTVLDENTKEQENAPVIQELDYSPLPAEDEAEAHEPAQEPPEEDSATGKKTKKNGKKKVPVAAVVIPVVLCVLLILPLALYTVLSVSVPNFSNLFSATTSAIFAKTNEERLEKYNEALKYCTEDSKLASMKQFLLEEIVLATADAQGYAAANAYMAQNMTDEMKADPQSKEFREFLGLEAELNKIADKVFQAATQAVGDKKDTDGIDYDALAESLKTPKTMKEGVASAFKFLCEAMASENASDSKEELQKALGLYMNSYSVLSDMGADCKLLLENIAVKLFDKGYMYEASLIINKLYKASEDEEIKSENKAFTDIVADLDGVKNVPCDLFAVAVKLYGEGKTAEADFAQAINSDIANAGVSVAVSEKAIKGLAQICITVAEGFEAQKERNLTKATTYFSTVLAALQTFNFPVEGVASTTAKLFLSTGDTQSANSIKEQYLADFTAETQEDKDFILKLDTLYKAQSAANEVFYPHYANTNYGQPMDKATVLADLDKLITPSSSSVDKAFVDYYKYLTVAFTDENKEEMAEYLDGFATALSEYPLVYGYALGQQYIDNGDFDKAVEIADKMLEVNIADDFANSVKAMALRIDNKLDLALEAAEKGMELSGISQHSALEAAIDRFIKGDYAESFDILKNLFEASLTETCCELIKVIEAKYDGSDEALKAELAQYSAQVNQIFGQYQLTASEKAKGLIDGTLTAEDVFLKAPYDFK